VSNYVRLAEAPEWCIQYPTCSACAVELDHDGDGWQCPSCGTAWSTDANDGDKGTLYADWAGEESNGPIVTEDQARQWGHYLELCERHRLLPEFCPEPKRPMFASEAPR